MGRNRGQVQEQDKTACVRAWEDAMHAHARSQRGASQGRVQYYVQEELEEQRVQGLYGEEGLSIFSQQVSLQGLT